MLCIITSRMTVVCLSGTGVHCNHTVHVSADLTLWLDSPMFLTLCHQRVSTVHLLPTVFFQFYLEERWVWIYKLGMVSQERLKVEIKLLLSRAAGRLIFLIVD